MKTVKQIIDYLNKSEQNFYVRIEYSNEWSLISKKLVKEFIKDIQKNNNKIYTTIDYEGVLWGCEEIKTETNTIVLKLKEVSNEYFINEFNEFQKLV